MKNSNYLILFKFQDVAVLVWGSQNFTQNPPFCEDFQDLLKSRQKSFKYIICIIVSVFNDIIRGHKQINKQYFLPPYMVIFLHIFWVLKFGCGVGAHVSDIDYVVYTQFIIVFSNFQRKMPEKQAVFVVGNKLIKSYDIALIIFNVPLRQRN